MNHKPVASIMSDLAIHGLPTPKSRCRNLIAIRTTSDLVNREFTATGPNQLWVTDIERHEAFLALAVVKGHRWMPVAAGV